MIRSFLTVSTGTLASRLLGFARDALIAALLGAGPVADAFLVAFSRARDAVATAVAAQQSLTKHPWPDGASAPGADGVAHGRARQ